MSMRKFASAVIAVALAIAPALLSASDQAGQPKTNKTAATASAETTSASQLATLKGVKAVPMASSELDAVKGLHVHFITISNGKLHLAGDVKTENNWSNEWGGSDGVAVAPSYHGLCVAHGNGQIFIPTGRGTPPPPVTLQCPPGS